MDPAAGSAQVMPLVEIRNLLVKRGEHPALQLDHLAIQNGEVLAVVGPNGAGKSTLLLTLARLLKPERGEIQFNGQPASAESDTIYRRRIALVMQDPLLFDTSVFDNVASGLRFRGITKDVIRHKVPLGWRDSVLGISRNGGQDSYLAGRRSASVWRAHWFSNRNCSSWMNRSPPSIRQPAAVCSTN